MRHGWHTSQLPPPDRTTQMESLQTAPLNWAQSPTTVIRSSPSPLPVLPAITSRINHWPSSPYHRVCVWGETQPNTWPFMAFAPLQPCHFSLQAAALLNILHIVLQRSHGVSHFVLLQTLLTLYGISPINSMLFTQKILTCSSKCNSVSTFPPNHCHPPPPVEGSLMCSYATKYLQICFL